MTNFYFNLNQIQSNPDGEPTVNRQSRLMSLSGKKAEKEQLSRDCLSLASELPLTCPRPDSLSLVSRQSDLDQVRAISAAFSTRVWKHVAMIFAVLVMSMANVGQVWGTEYATSTFFQAVSKATTASITPTEANAGTGDFITKDCSEAFTITSGGSAVIGYYSTSNGTTAKKWEYNSSNGGLKSKDTKIWIVLYSSEQFVAGDSIVIANGNNSTSGAYTIVGAAANNTSDFHEVSAVVSPSTTTPAKNTNYYYILPKVFTSSNYLVIRNNNTGTYFGGIYAYHKAAPASSDSYDIHIGKNNADYTDESLTNTSGTTWSKTITLDAGSYYEFKVKKTPSAGDAVWYGNNGKITASVASWTFSTGTDNCKLYTSVAGSYTFSWDASNNKLSVTYPAGEHPTKRIYMACGSTWCDASPKFFVHSWGVTEYNTQVQESTCDGYYADIIWYNDYFQFTRNASDATAYNNGSWTNYSENLTYNSSQTKWTCTGWSDGKGTFSSSAYSPTTYTISYAKGGTTATGGAAISGSKANESKTCGVDFTLPSSAVFTATGYTQTGWTTSDGGAQTHALGGSYTDNAAQTFYPVWTANQYTVTHTLDGVTKSSGATGANAATYGTNYTAVFAASSGYALPETITVTIGGSTKTAGTEYTWDKASGTVTITGSYITGNIVITITGESDDPCSEPAEVTNEIARFFVPCGTGTIKYEVTNQNASTGDNTFTTYKVGSTSADNWYVDATSGLRYGKLTANDSYISLKLSVGSFQAGDVVNLYVNCNNATKTGLKLKNQSTGNTVSVSSTAAKVEASGTYTLVAADIEADGSIKFFRENSSTFVNRIIITRPACTNVSITTQPTTPVAATVGSACSITGLVAAGTSPTYKWYTCNSDGSGATEITSAGAMSFTGYTTATLGLTPTATGATYYKCVVSGSCGDPVTSSVVTVNASAAAGLTAIEADVLYQAADMANITFTGSDQNFTGLSTNNLFKVYGTDGNAAKGKNENHNVTDDISTKSFTSALYILSNSNTTSTSDPTQGAIEFITPSTPGILYLYFDANNSALTLKKQGTSTSTSLSGAAYKAMTVDANTHYFINGATSGKRGLYGIQYVSTYAVSITPTNVTKATGDTGAGAAIKGKAYTATFTAPVGYTLPSDVTSLTIGGVAQTKGTGYTWTINDGTATLTVPAANVTGAISITVTGVAAESYSITYHCNGAESGCPSNVAAAYTLPSPLPTGMTKDGFDFGGWFTDSECTVAAVAGAALTGNTDLYAKWTERGSECEDTPHAWDVIATGAKSYKVRISKVTEEVAIPVADATASNLTAYAGSVSTNDNVTVQIADGGSSQYGYKFDGGNTYLKLVFSTPLVLNDTLVVGMTNASHNISFTTTAARATTLSTSGGKLIIPAALAGQSTLYLWRGSGSTMYLRSFAVKHACDALPSCTTPALPTLSNQSLCEGADIAEWNATVTNASTISAAGETVTYSWKKKGNATELANTASFDLGASAAESQAGTYVVTVTVSKAGYASATATKEVTLTVNEATEVTAITADKATVYPGNSVTLTATANMDATWQWYTCTNAEGDGEAIISGAESASYTITSAGSAGTYYYKVKATGSCGIGSMVYTLTVSAAAGGDCETYYFFANADDATTNGVTQNADDFFSGAKAGTNNNSTNITVDGNKLTITKRNSAAAYSVVFTVPTGATASLYTNAKANSNTNKLTITRSSDSESMVVTDQTALANYTLSDIPEGTWTLTCGSGNNWYYGAIIVKVCSGTACTDPEVTASVNNSTACVGTSVTFSATGAHASATYQWQKYSGGAWTNIASATAATYNIASVATTDAMKYRVIASHECNRTSNEVTLNVPVAPVFADFTATRSVMATLALSIIDVEASDATSYAWYKSANATYDAGTDTKVGTTQELLLASGGEAAGSTYYLFCVASNSCGSTTSSAITVNVTAFIEEDCATKGSEGAADFGFNYESGIGSGNAPNTSIPCWKSQGKAAYLTYTAPDGKYFSRVTMNVLVSSGSKAAYGYSTDGGTTWTYADLTGLTSSLADKSLTLPANVNAFRVGRNFDPSYGVTSGTFYLSKICFEYTDACTATTVTPDATSKTHTIGESFTAPIFTLAPGAVSSGTLTYSSSDEEIASVDESGNVTFNGTAGTVTITAAYAGATIADVDYCASEGSYTITVSCEGGAPKVVADGSVNMSGCNSSVTLNAKKQDGKTDFTGGSYQWFRNGEEIAGATGKSYTASQTGVYTVAYTSAGGCTSPSTNNATVTSATVEPEVTKLVPFHYYHVDKTYTAQMKDRHLFSVKGSAAYGSTGKNFKLTMSRNGGAETDMTTAASIWVKRSDDGQVDTVMIDLNKLSGKYSEGDELVLTCVAVDCSGNVSAVYKDEITINVIGATPTLALICSGTSKAEGTRKTSELTVGGDFLTGYNVADLCQQTGNTSFDANTEWGLYTDLKANYIVTPVNGYAVFNKLNYEPFDILLLTDYPKASKSDAAKDVLDDMAALCDYRPMLSFKTHMVAKSPSKWAAKGFTTSATENKADGRLNLNIVCYAHPMFDAIKTGDDVYNDTENTSAPLIYTMLSGTGHEGNKGMQGFEIAAAENFVTIGLTHYNATIAKVGTNATWTPGSEDRMLVTVAERQTNIEARMILFSLNCGAQSKLTDKGEQVVLACLNYLLETDPLKVADCSFTFDNGASNEHNAAWYAEHCPGCTGTKGDGLWSTAANWAPDYRLLPGEFTSVRIAAPVTVDLEHAHVLDARIKEGGQIIIPAGKGLDMKGTIRRLDGSEISPTENSDLFLGSTSAGNGSLIFNNDKGDTKATVAMYTTALADIENMSATTSTWQYIGTPHNDVARATYNYYDSWLYQYSGSGWEVIPNGGPLVPFRGYCVTHPQANHTFVMYGTLTATTNVDIEVPAGYTVIANSWVAPIDITTLTDDDMEDIDDKTIYFFNTGSDAEGENGTGTAPGTYVAVPKNAASYVGNWQIPSMQGFYLSSSTAGTLHLDYGRHVRPAGERTTIVNNPMYAPRRAKAADEEPLVLKMFARGSRYHDKLVVLEREDFTTGYDSGWDGEAWGGSDLSPQIYVIGGGRYDAVSAIPDFEGTVVAFRAGEDEEYTIDFIYDAENEPLYLFDTENNSYTQIVTGGAYHFTTSDKAAHSRFILTRHAPQIATGCENLDGGEGAKAKKLLIEDKMFIMVNGLLYDATGKVVK